MASFVDYVVILKNNLTTLNNSVVTEQTTSFRLWSSAVWRRAIRYKANDIPEKVQLP
jgi:hypothetical protein